MTIRDYFKSIKCDIGDKKDADLLQELIDSHRYLRDQNGSRLDMLIKMPRFVRRIHTWVERYYYKKLK